MLKTNEAVRKLFSNNEKLRTLTQTDVEQVQQVLLGMMDDFDRLCRKHGLTYFLCGGTALGAARHQGFIPWDDDADLAMPRADFDRLTELVTAEYGDRYWVQSLENNALYDLPFLKIRKKGTRFLELFEPDPEHAGIFLDIYPLENVPDFCVFRWIHGAVSDFLHLCCSCVKMNAKKERYFAYFEDEKFLKTVKTKAFIGKCLSFFSVHRWCVMSAHWDSCCRNEKSKYVSFPSGRKHYFGEVFDRTTALPVKDVPFAGRSYLSMAQPDKYLRNLYGNYHRIPPVENREAHGILELELGETNE